MFVDFFFNSNHAHESLMMSLRCDFFCIREISPSARTAPLENTQVFHATIIMMKHVFKAVVFQTACVLNYAA